MSSQELGRYLDDRRTLIVATTGQDGRPHLTALWFVMRDGQPWIFTYEKSQKVRNLERVPAATLLLESGKEYSELQGAMIYADVTIHRDPDVVQQVGEELFLRYANRGANGASGLDATTREAVRSRAEKRVAIEFSPTRVVSWDHSKLGGTY